MTFEVACDQDHTIELKAKKEKLNPSPKNVTVMDDDKAQYFGWPDVESAQVECFD
ncbi:MAG: hypothetical protein J6U64_00685 [Alphaproteobacteria bacterium]|nr:hypothetical protein [Alphaproteobacteria bacterium]